MERVNFSYRVFDNCLEIIPDEGIKNNSVYKLTLRDIRSAEGHKVLDKKTFEITTAMTPAYCSVDAIRTLVDVFDVSESTILFQIRQASKEADFIWRSVYDKPIVRDADGNYPFPIERFTEVRASQLALTKAYITGTSESGLEGTLGKISFKNGEELGNIRKLIDDLKKEADKWQDAIRGYVFGGRNTPAYALRGNRSWRATPAAAILNNYNRNGNMGLKGGYII